MARNNVSLSDPVLEQLINGHFETKAYTLTRLDPLSLAKCGLTLPITMLDGDNYC